MKTLMIIFLLLAPGVSGKEDIPDLLFMFWNLENFFDSFDDGDGESDKEFSPDGDRRWSYSRFIKKLNLTCKTVLWVAGCEGRMPDAIGFAELENALVLRRLLQSDMLRDMDWKHVHYDSPDPRGIDVGLIYRSSTLELLESRPVHIYEDDGEIMKTRDILLALFRVRGKGDTIALTVNHHPSKYGGKSSMVRREKAMLALSSLCDSISCPMIAMGDFNDTPDATQFSLIEERLENKAERLFLEGEGTIRYQGRWELIDMFLESRDTGWDSEMKICRVPYLMAADRPHGGMKPLRTYSGPRYSFGVSDHLPVVLKVKNK
ncbi:MAG: hypothetical protein HUJ94_03345 [Bacteroidales bacterium]|nr:hypothetical protein [Bacteroidales bacterium]